MSVTLPGTEIPLSVGDIRAFLRDQPKYNVLLDDVEFEDPDIERGIRFATARYNALTPISNLQAYQINEFVLLSGVCCILFRSEGARQLRNQVTAQDGNIAPVGIDEKQALYAEWAERFCAEFDRFSQNIKIQKNLEGMYYGEGGPGFGSGAPALRPSSPAWVSSSRDCCAADSWPFNFSSGSRGPVRTGALCG